VAGKRINLETIAKYVDLATLVSPKGASTRAERTREESLREYDVDKWGKLLEDALDRKVESVEQLDQLFLGTQEGVYSSGESLFWSSSLASLKLYNREVSKRLKRLSKHEGFVELGAGYGSVILNHLGSLPRKLRSLRHFALEFSPRGQECLSLVSAEYNVVIGECDFLSPVPFGGIPSNSVVFTSNSLIVVEKTTEAFLNALINSGPKFIVFFEPIIQFYGDSLLGQLRSAYHIKNRYNSEIYPALKKLSDEGKITIASIEKNFFGENFLLPTSSIIWYPNPPTAPPLPLQ